MTETGIHDSATEEEGGTPVLAATANIKDQSRSFWQMARRDLSEEELSSPAARRFFIAELERLHSENSDLRTYQSKYYAIFTELAVLREREKKSGWNELLSFVTLSVGAAGLGAAPSYIPNPVGWMMLAFAIVLLGAGIASRVWK